MNRKIIIFFLFLFSFIITVFAQSDVSCIEQARQKSLDGSRYMQKSNFIEAVQSFNNALELCKKCYPMDSIAVSPEKNVIKSVYLASYLGLYSSYFALKDFQEAIAISEEGARNLTENSWLFNESMAVIHTEQGEYQKAIDICKKTLQSFPDSYTTYALLGRIYYKMNDYENTRINLTKALEISESKGDTEVAVQCEKILKSIPSN